MSTQVIQPEELDIIAEKISKIYNVPVEDAKKTLQLVFSDKDRLERIKSRIEKLKEMKPVLDETPEGIKEAYHSLILRSIVEDVKRGDLDSVIKAMLVKSLIDGSERKNGEVDALKAEIEEIKKYLSDLHQSQQNKVIEDLTKKIDTLFEEVKKLKGQPQQQQNTVPDYIKKLIEDLEALKKEVSELKSQPPLVNRIEQTFKEIETIKSALEKYGLITSGNAGAQIQPNPDKLAEELKKYGYEVKKLTPDDISKILEEERKRLREQLENELQIEKARIESIKELIKAGIDSVVKPIMDTITQSMRESFTQSLKLRLAQQYMQMQQQAQKPAQPQTNSATPIQQTSNKVAVEGGKSAPREPQSSSEKSG